MSAHLVTLTDLHNFSPSWKPQSSTTPRLVPHGHTTISRASMYATTLTYCCPKSWLHSLRISWWRHVMENFVRREQNGDSLFLQLGKSWRKEEETWKWGWTTWTMRTASKTIWGVAFSEMSRRELKTRSGRGARYPKISEKCKRAVSLLKY